MIIMDRSHLERSVEEWSRGDRSAGLSKLYSSHSSGVPADAQPARKQIVAANDRAPAPFIFGGG